MNFLALALIVERLSPFDSLVELPRLRNLRSMPSAIRRLQIHLELSFQGFRA